MKLKYTIKRMDKEIFLYCIKKELTYKVDDYIIDILKIVDENLEKGININEVFNITTTTDINRFVNNIAMLIKLGVIEVDNNNNIKSFNVINFKDIDFDKEITICEGYSRPEVVYWIFTNLCNLHCGHCCWENHYNSEDELKETEILNIIDQIAALNVSKISFSGGEPTSKYDKLLKAI